MSRCAAAQRPDFFCRTDKGFTLLEVLIVLVLLSLVVSLLAAGLSMTFSLRERLLEQQQQLRVQTLESHWFRSVCSSFTPEQKPGGEHFSGTPLRIQGLALSPLLSAAGAPRRVELLLEQQGPVVVLQYRQDTGKLLEIGRWQADSGSFVFFDSEWKQQDRWPPRTFHESARLPRAILLKLDLPGSSLSWFAPITGRMQPRPWVIFNER